MKNQISVVIADDHRFICDLLLPLSLVQAVEQLLIETIYGKTR